MVSPRLRLKWKRSDLLSQVPVVPGARHGDEHPDVEAARSLRDGERVLNEEKPKDPEPSPNWPFPTPPIPRG